MARQIIVKDDSDSGEDPQLVAKIDQMMDPEQPKSLPIPTVNTKETVTEPIVAEDSSKKPLPPLDIFADTPGAPLLLKDKTSKKIKKSSSKKTEEAKTPIDDEPLPETVATKPEADMTEPEVTPAINKDDKDNEEQVSESVKADSPKVEDYDDPKTTKAIEEIIASESALSLSSADEQTKNQAAKSQPVKTKDHGHPIFWSLVAVVCIIAIVIGVFLADPSIHNPLSKIHWSSIRKHF